MAVTRVLHRTARPGLPATPRPQPLSETKPQPPPAATQASHFSHRHRQERRIGNEQRTTEKRIKPARPDDARAVRCLAKLEEQSLCHAR